MNRPQLDPFIHAPSGLHLEPVTPEHFEQMQAIERASFPTSWPADSFARETEDNRVAAYLAATRDGRVLGYVGAWIILDEVHITTLAVDPEARGQRIGRLLLARLLFCAIAAGARWTVLEVRASNLAALRLYEHFGFRQVGKRKRYYENDEDALVLWVGAMQSLEFREKVCQALDLAPHHLPPGPCLDEVGDAAPEQD